MAKATLSSSSSSSAASPFRSAASLPRSPIFTPIPEHGDMEEEEEEETDAEVLRPPPPTPAAKPPPSASPSHAVNCSNCRPSTREKKPTSVVPLDPSGSPQTPGVLKSLLTSLTRRTPQPPTAADWKHAASELSRKLLHATRRRDEALLEASALRRRMAELERELSRKLPLDAFLRAVSESRTMVQHLARKLSGDARPAAALHHLEGMLNRIFYEDFETSGFERGGPDRVLGPVERARANLSAFESLKRLTWEEVLSKGTRHFSEGLSQFCDRKMSDVVALLEPVHAWPEPLLQAFFGAAKAVWLVHLLAWSVHPAIPRFRVGAGSRFDPAYMEAVAGRTGPVQLMVAPGFYVHTSVIKCKVMCVYSDGSGETRAARGAHVMSPRRDQLVA